ncbi:MAG: hypothetical protein QME42_00320 [bacterium]|nr:hypothetical protein [bacterium]
MEQQKIIFLNKVLVVIVCLLIGYAGVGIILFFSPPHQEYKISGKNHKITDVDKKESTATPPVPPSSPPFSHYEKVSSGRIFRSFISIPSLPTPSFPSEVKKIQEEKPVVVEQEVIFQLIGITWGEDGANALIKSSQESQTQLITIGDKISGYQVTGITKEAVVLVKGNERKVVELEYLK